MCGRRAGSAFAYLHWPQRDGSWTRSCAYSFSLLQKPRPTCIEPTACHGSAGMAGALPDETPASRPVRARFSVHVLILTRCKNDQHWRIMCSFKAGALRDETPASRPVLARFSVHMLILTRCKNDQHRRIMCSFMSGACRLGRQQAGERVPSSRFMCSFLLAAKMTSFGASRAHSYSLRK